LLVASRQSRLRVLIGWSIGWLLPSTLRSPLVPSLVDHGQPAPRSSVCVPGPRRLSIRARASPPQMLSFSPRWTNDPSPSLRFLPSLQRALSAYPVRPRGPVHGVCTLPRPRSSCLSFPQAFPKSLRSETVTLSTASAGSSPPQTYRLVAREDLGCFYRILFDLTLNPRSLCLAAPRSTSGCFRRVSAACSEAPFQRPRYALLSPRR